MENTEKTSKTSKTTEIRTQHVLLQNLCQNSIIGLSIERLPPCTTDPLNSPPLTQQNFYFVALWKGQLKRPKDWPFPNDGVQCQNWSLNKIMVLLAFAPQSYRICSDLRRSSWFLLYSALTECQELFRKSIDIFLWKTRISSTIFWILRFNPGLFTLL